MEVVADSEHCIRVAQFDSFLEIVHGFSFVALGFFVIHVGPSQEVVCHAGFVLFGSSFIISTGEVDIERNSQPRFVNQSDMKQCIGVFGIVFDVLQVVVQRFAIVLFGFQRIVISSQVPGCRFVILLNRQAEHGKSFFNVPGNIGRPFHEYESATV